MLDKIRARPWQRDWSPFHDCGQGVRIQKGFGRGHQAGSRVKNGRRSGLGVALGLPVCLALSTLLASQVPFLESFDPLVYLLVPPALLGSAMLASLVPALRAVTIDPVAAIRED